jgi:HD-GYP domain-containing protein (c-di-GMP phosphodiesterase class II)
MLTDKEKLEKLTNLGVELNKVKDLDILMERVLYDARQFVNADAGSIYIREQDSLDFTYSQNDTLQSRLREGDKLIYSTFSMPIDKKSIAGYVAFTGQPVNISDVYDIDAAAPYSFSKKFDKQSGYKTGSVFTVPLITPREDILGILQIINAQDESGRIIPFSENDEKILLHFASIAAVALLRAQMTRTLLLRMIRMSELRDPKETGSHVNRVGGYAVELYTHWARRNKIDSKEIERNRDSLRMAAMLHDVGKVAISDRILKKPGRLTEDEFEIMKEHTTLGARLFLDAQSDFDELALEVALNHHERWDGQGYPGHINVATGAPLNGFRMPDGRARGKKGEEIPIFGRIVALADLYDALSYARIYKEAWDEPDVLLNIKEESGHKLDPELVEIFFSRINILREIQNRYQEDS